jgi:molybdate transport system substrate-binding protein
MPLHQTDSNYWKRLLLPISSLVAAILIACAPQPQSPPTAPLLVAAAASLQQALQDITPLYAPATASQTLRYNFAASGALQQQIEQGAPVDVFISAADKQMKALRDKGLIASETILLTNQLVLITPKQSSVTLTDFRQLAAPTVQRIAIGEPRSVPAGQYATEVLRHLGILDAVRSKFVLSNSVKSVLTAVETGDVDAGIVYITDAKSSNQVNIAAIANSQLHGAIRYPIGILKSTRSPENSQRYVDFLQSQAAQAIFKKYGFGLIQPDHSPPKLKDNL